MPYPVLPPALPPVADVVLPEASNRVPSDLGFAPASTVQAQSVGDSAVCTQETCESGMPASTAGEVNDSEVNSAASDFNAPSQASVLENGSTTAALLGRPLSVGLPSLGVSLVEPVHSPSTGAISQVVPSTGSSVVPARPTTFWQLPDLDALMEARRQPVSTRSASSRSTLPSQTSASTLDQSAQLPTLDERESQSPRPDSIRLDLPTPETEAEPAVESDQSEPAPESEEPPVQFELIPPSPMPTPLPDSTGGEVLTIPTPPRNQNEGRPEETQTSPVSPPVGGNPPGESVPIDPQAVGEVLEVTGDRQEFNERQQIFEAEGNVAVRFRQGLLTADRVRVNIPNRVAVAEGNAILTRGEQVLRGERFEYNFGLNQGNVQTARGELLIPAAGRDLDPNPLAELNTTGAQGLGSAASTQPVTQRVSSVQPLQVLGGVPGPAFGFGNRSLQSGSLTRLRFEADRAEFVGGGLVAENVRITNDPFSPPELELRSSRATYTRLSPTQAEIRARNPRLVFDQGFSLPLLVDRIVLDSRRRNNSLFSFGFDERDRDGFYIERPFNLYSSPLVSFSLTPQILVQRAIEQGGFPEADQFGLVAEADFQFTPTTTGRAVASFSSLDFSEVEDNLRASVRAQQRVFNHTVSIEYSYRDRLFNGSLGFQDIQSSVGLVVTSPVYVLGSSLINLSYLGSVQYVNAQTDQQDLYNSAFLDRDLSCIEPKDRDTTVNGCADLTRYQAAVLLNRLFLLWVGPPLPATPTEGLRYSPTPVVPYVGIYTEGRGIYTAYSNGDTQSSLRGGISLLGQFGHFSKPLFDYTAFSLGYYNTLAGGKSPFLFDRTADEEFIAASLTQQIYGPLRFGVQISYNLQTQDEIDTVYTLEYSRRTYSISASYSTGREAAAITFRLNDFNWTGDPGPFSGLGSRTVESGVIQGIN